MKPEIEQIARRISRAHNIHHFGRDTDAGWQASQLSAKMVWDEAEIIAQSKGYISLWSPSRDLRQKFIDEAFAAYQDRT